MSNVLILNKRIHIHHHIFVYSEKAGRQTTSPQKTVITEKLREEGGEGETDRLRHQRHRE